MVYVLGVLLFPLCCCFLLLLLFVFCFFLSSCCVGISAEHLRFLFRKSCCIKQSAEHLLAALRMNQILPMRAACYDVVLARVPISRGNGDIFCWSFMMGITHVACAHYTKGCVILVAFYEPWSITRCLHCFARHCVGTRRTGFPAREQCSMRCPISLRHVMGKALVCFLTCMLHL